jgi:FHS family L-fucose permease-like MFS transporter
MSNAGTTVRTPSIAGDKRPLIIVTTLFFLWGFLTSLNDVLVPRLKGAFHLSYTEVMLVQAAFFSAYFLFSIPWAKCVDFLGYKNTMVSSLCVMALGAFLFLPAASIPSFPLFLAALLVLGAGITGLQVAANPYVVFLGPPQTASSRLTLTQAFNSLGTSIAPKVGGVLILGATLATASLNATQQTGSVKRPYLVIGASLIIMAFIVARLTLPSIPRERKMPGILSQDSLFKHPNLLFGIFALFAYVGAEVTIGSLMVNYLGLSRIASFSALAASSYVSFYWGGAMLGRFAGSGLLKHANPRLVLATFAICAGALVILSVSTSGHTAMWTLLAVGLFNSIMYPTIFTLGIAELGPLSSIGSGLLNMASVGGALFPIATGVLADRVGLQHALTLTAACYTYILFYAIRGSRTPSEICDSRHIPGHPSPPHSRIEGRNVANRHSVIALSRDERRVNFVPNASTTFW